MKNTAGRIVLILFAGILFFGVSSQNARAQNSVSGMIFDTSRQPVSKIEVELLDEYERLIRSTKTNGTGVYFFAGLRAGVYYVQIRTAGTNYRGRKERFEVGRGVRGGGITGSEALQLDLVLDLDRRNNSAQLSNEVVFAQDVPREAEKYFEIAVKKIDDKKSDEAIVELENALKIFPEYFLALEKIGYEYLTKGRFAESESGFMRALQVNPKSFSAKTGLGIAEYKLGKMREAAKTLEESIALNQNSPNSFLFLGKIYRELREFERAETSMKKAKELGKNKIPDVHWELALLYYHNLKRPADAADELELYLKAKPDADNRTQVEKLIQQMRQKAKEKS